MQIIKFGMVGLLGTFTHYAVLILGVNNLGFPVLLSTSTGFILGALINHHFNRRFTFSSEKSYLKTLIQFFASASILFVLNLLLMYIFVEHLTIQYIIAQIITTGIVFIVGFVINKKIVFKS